MNPSRFQSLIRECIREVLQEEDLKRVCMYCELIFLTPPGKKSHGYCREHYIAMMMDLLKKPHEVAVQMADKAEVGQGFTPNTSGAKETDPLPEHEDHVFTK